MLGLELTFFFLYLNLCAIRLQLMCLCEFGLGLQQQMPGKELRGRVIGLVGPNKEKQVAFLGSDKEKATTLL
jgi:hypothetical protein